MRGGVDSMIEDSLGNLHEGLAARNCYLIDASYRNQSLIITHKPARNLPHQLPDCIEHLHAGRSHQTCPYPDLFEQLQRHHQCIAISTSKWQNAVQ
jgi:hypothetical protein